MTVMNESILNEMRTRNIERAKKKAVEMGDRWVLHGSHRVQRKDCQPGVLEIPRFLLRSQ